MRTIQDIIDNQEGFKKEIYFWLKDYIASSREELKSIVVDDDYIQSEKEKLKARINPVKYKKYVDRLFFMHNSRNKEYYIWWDEINEEALILKYENRREQ